MVVVVVVAVAAMMVVVVVVVVRETERKRETRFARDVDQDTALSRAYTEARLCARASVKEKE